MFVLPKLLEVLKEPSLKSFYLICILKWDSQLFKDAGLTEHSVKDHGCYELSLYLLENFKKCMKLSAFHPVTCMKVYSSIIQTFIFQRSFKQL